MDDYWKNWVIRLNPIAEKSGTSASCLINWVLQNIGIETNIRFLNALTVTVEQNKKIESDLARLMAHEPISKIVQSKEFFGRTFKTTHDTLDPRYDSETLIDAMLAYFPRDDALRFVDLGTGTGCLLITLLCEFPYATGVAVDFCPKALAVARENARKYGVFDRISFCLSDWCTNLIIEEFDGIISNPPYIRDDYPLDSSVVNFDPLHALFAGKDGLDAYRTLFDQLPRFCKSNTKIIFEIGFDQAESVSAIAREKGFRLLDTKLDTAGIARALVFDKVHTHQIPIN